MTTTPHGRRPPMQVIVGDRRKGKTTKLVKWLLEGKQIPDYPGWNRAIVCAHRGSVVHTTRMVKDLVYNGWQFRDEQYMTHLVDTHKQVDQRLRVDVSKAVWSLADLDSVWRGRQDRFEFAVDDLDHLMSVGVMLPGPPAVVAINGVMYDGPQ